MFFRRCLIWDATRRRRVGRPKSESRGARFRLRADVPQSARVGAIACAKLDRRSKTSVSLKLPFVPLDWPISPASRNSRRTSPSQLKRPRSGARPWITCCYMVRRVWARRPRHHHRPRVGCDFRRDFRADSSKEAGPDRRVDEYPSTRQVLLIYFIYGQFAVRATSIRRWKIFHGHSDRHRTRRTDHSIAMQQFKAIGATTRNGLVSAPLRGRFGLVLRLNHYGVGELKAIGGEDTNLNQ